VTIGVVACVEATTTTIVPTTTATPPSTTPTTSGTTTLPTTAQTTTVCQKDMANVGGIYVSSVQFTPPLVPGSSDYDLTSATSNGVTFQSSSAATGLFDQYNQPLYTITMTFNPAGVNSISSVVANQDSNVKQFSVEFFGLSNPNQLLTVPAGTIPVSYNSTVTNSQVLLVALPEDAPSEISGIRISILSTVNDE
jgi:hypothetical protein